MDSHNPWDSLWVHAIWFGAVMVFVPLIVWLTSNVVVEGHYKRRFRQNLAVLMKMASVMFVAWGWKDVVVAVELLIGVPLTCDQREQIAGVDPSCSDDGWDKRLLYATEYLACMVAVTLISAAHCRILLPLRPPATR